MSHLGSAHFSVELSLVNPSTASDGFVPDVNIPSLNLQPDGALLEERTTTKTKKRFDIFDAYDTSHRTINRGLV